MLVVVVQYTHISVTCIKLLFFIFLNLIVFLQNGFWMLALFSYFVIEMVVILMNLIIGLAISNIQEMRQNADALRLAKEVLLQSQLETLLQVISKEGSILRKKLIQKINNSFWPLSTVRCTWGWLFRSKNFDFVAVFGKKLAALPKARNKNCI